MRIEGGYKTGIEPNYRTGFQPMRARAASWPGQRSSQTIGSLFFFGISGPGSGPRGRSQIPYTKSVLILKPSSGIKSSSNLCNLTSRYYGVPYLYGSKCLKFSTLNVIY